MVGLEVAPVTAQSAISRLKTPLSKRPRETVSSRIETPVRHAHQRQAARHRLLRPTPPLTAPLAQAMQPLRALAGGSVPAADESEQ